MKKRLNLVFLLAGLQAIAQTPFEIQKLEDFAKLYGTVRYFHPSDEASAIDWKAFALLGVKEIKEAKTLKEFENKIMGLFSPVAPSLTYNNKPYQWDDAAPYPVYWIHKGLGIDSKSHNFYSSHRFNKSKNSTGTKAATLFLPLEIEKGTGIKLVYEARTDGGSLFGYLKLLDQKNNNIATVLHDKDPVTANGWQVKALTAPAFQNLKQVLIAFFSEGGDSQFRNAQLLVEGPEGVWNEIALPSLNDPQWFVEPKGDYLVRQDDQITIKQRVSGKQLHSLETNLPLDNYFTPNLSTVAGIIVPSVVYANQERTLPAADKSLFEDLKDRLQSQPKDVFDQDMQIANIIMVWNVFRHFYPYHTEIAIDWEGILTAALIDARNNTRKDRHTATLEKLTENFKDGHINISSKEAIPHDALYATPAKFKVVNNNLIIAGIAGNFKGKLKRGDIIAAINGRPAGVYLDSICQYISGSEQHKQSKALKRMNTGQEGSVLAIKTANGRKAVLVRNTAYEQNKDFYEADTTENYKAVTDDIFYINLAKLTHEDVDSLIPAINRNKGLIIDLRGYPEDNKHRLFSYLSAVDTAAWLCSLTFLQPCFSKIEQNCNNYGLNTKKAAVTLKTKNAVLINENTISNGELFAQLLKHYNLATIIGRPSAGANGNINRIELLGGFSFVFTGAKIKNPDGSRFHAIGVMPDIYVEESVKDVKRGNDAFIDKAIEVLAQ